jgi:hypothetical protein
MPHVLAAGDITLRDFKGFCGSRSPMRGNAMPVLAGHSRLILLVFHVDPTVQT